MERPSYKDTLENFLDREYILYSLSLDIATQIGKLAVVKDNERLKAVFISDILTSRLDRMLAIHKAITPIKERDATIKLGRPSKRVRLAERPGDKFKAELRDIEQKN